MQEKYLFTSERLGFRNWKESDIPKMFEISSDPIVMKHFPAIQSLQYTADFITRMQAQFLKNSYCYFAVELLQTQEFIGFIGLCEQTYEANFNPATDIGWRLHPHFWNQGYATEGARACLHYAFQTIHLKKVVSVATKGNIPSISVMKKIGMTKVKEFKHPSLTDFPELIDCVLYEIES
jgi:RimJ/RimL family protein N-acetyltransferase